MESLIDSLRIQVRIFGGDRCVFDLTVLDKSDISGLLAEALTADVETVFADETGFVCADSAGASSLAVGAWARVPDALVRHDWRFWYL